MTRILIKISPFLLAVLLIFGNCTCEEKKEIQRPNILFIAVDDMNDWVGALGHKQSKTPNIDRLAQRGILFTNAHCAAPVCHPSRTAVMTGLNPFNTGVYENYTAMRKVAPDVVTLSQYFRQNGYKAYGGGKIFHDPPPHNYDPDSFDEYYWWNEDGPKGALVADRWRSPYSVLPDPELEGRPIRKITPLTKRNFDWGAVDQPEMDWPDYKVTEWASEVLTEEHSDPFFLAVGIFRPHVPWFNPMKYSEIYPIEEIELPLIKEDDLEDLGVAAKFRALDNASQHDKVQEFGEWQGAVQAYLASISFADAMLGRLLDALDRSKYKDNTIIVFWSDHGYHLGEKRHWHKRTLWERSTHVPFIIAAPGITEEGSESGEAVSLIDIYPTLIDLCRLPQMDSLDGNILTPLLKETDLDWPYPAITTHGPGNHSVRTEEWRYIQYANGEEELYNHKSDPNEWDNLANESKMQAVKEELASWLPDNEKIKTDHSKVNEKIYGLGQ